MHQRDLYVVQVKQYCDSVNTFPTIYFHAMKKLALMLFLFNFLIFEF